MEYVDTTTEEIGIFTIAKTTTTTTIAPETAPPGSNCDSLVCYNGATLGENPCQCICASGYQGEACSGKKLFIV